MHAVPPRADPLGYLRALWAAGVTELADRALAAFDRGAGIRVPGTLWERVGWRCALEANDRIRLERAGTSIAYETPGVVLAPAPSSRRTPATQEIVLKTRGAARELFNRTDSEISISGPAGTGKSLPCLARVHLACLMYPGIRSLVVRKTAVSLGSTTLVTFEKKVATEAITLGLTAWYGGSTREAASYRYVNGSVIVVGGLDKPIKVMSAEYDLIFADEATELIIDDWEALGTRLGRNNMLPWQQQIAALNPGPPTHWIKQRSDVGGMPMLHSRHVDNPAMFDDDGNPTERGTNYLAILDKLTGVRRLRLLEGIWAAAEGVIYTGWDEATHLVDELPEGLVDTGTLYLTVDFGYVHAFVAQAWLVDHDGRIWLWWEIHMTGRTVDEHARTIVAQLADPIPGYQHPPGEPRYAYHGHRFHHRPRSVVCDHDAEGRAVLERELGMGTSAAHKAVTEGIQAMQQRLRPAGDGRPRMFVLRSSLVELDQDAADAKKPTCFAQEVTSYVWDSTKGKGMKETPVKVDDDSMDCARYICAELDLGARPRMRWM